MNCQEHDGCMFWNGSDIDYIERCNARLLRNIIYDFFLYYKTYITTKNRYEHTICYQRYFELLMTLREDVFCEYNIELTRKATKRESGGYFTDYSIKDEDPTYGFLVLTDKINNDRWIIPLNKRIVIEIIEQVDYYFKKNK